MTTPNNFTIYPYTYKGVRFTVRDNTTAGPAILSVLMGRTPKCPVNHRVKVWDPTNKEVSVYDGPASGAPDIIKLYITE